MPIVNLVGLVGMAGTGKTSTAEAIQRETAKNFGAPRQAELIAFARPLYSMAAVLQKSEGIRRKDRVLYAIHEILAETFGPPLSAEDPSYDDLVILTKHVSQLPVTPEDEKPRVFLQKAGDLLRFVKEDVLLLWVKGRIARAASKADADYIPQVIVTDVRTMDEVVFLRSLGAELVELYCAEDTRAARMTERGEDYQKVTTHNTESSVEAIDPDLINLRIDTGLQSLEEVVDSIFDGTSLSRVEEPNAGEVSERPERTDEHDLLPFPQGQSR